MGQVFLKSEESDLEYFDYDVTLQNNTLDQFDSLLSKYEEWTSFKRDIKLLNILESGKKIQFDIESIYLFARLGDNENIFLTLQLSVLTIKSMSFILKENKILKLTVRCKLLETPMGKVIKELIENSIEVELRPRIIDDKVVYFYIDYDTKNVA